MIINNYEVPIIFKFHYKTFILIACDILVNTIYKNYTSYVFVILLMLKFSCIHKLLICLKVKIPFIQKGYNNFNSIKFNIKKRYRY